MKNHTYIPSAIFATILLLLDLILFQFTSLDIQIQDIFYNFDSLSWLSPGKDDSLRHFILYSGEKKLIVIFGVSILISLLFFRKKRIVASYQKGLIIVLLSLIIIPFVVGQLKGSTNMPCPFQVKNYGGKFPEPKLFSHYPDSFVQIEKAKCYPAGHAAGGFALMSLYFLFKTNRNRRIALVGAFLVGWITGVYKMMMGDHFFSHTLTTMLLSWILIVIIYTIVSRYVKD